MAPASAGAICVYGVGQARPVTSIASEVSRLLWHLELVIHQANGPAAHTFREPLRTIDAVTEVIAADSKITAGERNDVARWIASRQGLPGAYANSYAGFVQEWQNGIRLFTGERVGSASALVLMHPGHRRHS